MGCLYNWLFDLVNFYLLGVQTEVCFSLTLLWFINVLLPLTKLEATVFHLHRAALFQTGKLCRKDCFRNGYLSLGFDCKFLTLNLGIIIQEMLLRKGKHMVNELSNIFLKQPTEEKISLQNTDERLFILLQKIVPPILQSVMLPQRSSTFLSFLAGWINNKLNNLIHSQSKTCASCVLPQC